MTELSPRDALVAVDVQRDFCPGGKLAVPEGDAVIAPLNHWIEKARPSGARVVASHDWHPPDHVSFTPQGGQWPVHCVQNTDGAAFHPDLHLPHNALIVAKGANPEFDQYSAFDHTGLAESLHQRGIERLWVGGLALDVCVKATVIDACRHGFETHLIRSATRPVNVQPDDDQRALEQMQNAGAIIEED